MLASVDANLIALQEVTQNSFDDLRPNLVHDWSICSLNLPGSTLSPARGRPLGTALFGRAPFHLQSAQLIDGTPLPERFLAGSVVGPFGTFAACSFHIPPGSNWGAVKSRSFHAIGQWATTQCTPTLIGMEANAPALRCLTRLKVLREVAFDPVLFLAPNGGLVRTISTRSAWP
jgi:hypothetical protein